METETTKPAKRKPVTAAGIMSVVVAAAFLAFGIVLLVALVQTLNAPDADYGIYYVLYFFDGAITTAFVIFAAAFTVIFYAAAVAHTLMGVVLIRQGQPGLVKVVLIVSLAISAGIALVALYPFVTGIARVIVHGPQDELTRFLVLGLLPLSISTVSVALNAVAIKKAKTS